MKKQLVHSNVPGLGVPLNLAVRFGPLFFVSGLPPFHGEYATRLREARTRGEPAPPFPDMPFEEQAEIVMEHLKQIVEAAGSTMDHLLKVNVWLKNQSDMTKFDRVYRRYFSSTETLPARTRLQSGATPLGCGLEVEAIGCIPGASWDGFGPAKKARKPAAAKRKRATKARRKR
jgi:2-iminobutanoate/2-iminopropanoate deaminase